jgi:hypothetical protein
MAGFLGWVTGVVADLLNWVVGVWSSAGGGVGLHPQVMEFASVLMRFLLVCGGVLCCVAQVGRCHTWDVNNDHTS